MVSFFLNIMIKSSLRIFYQKIFKGMLEYFEYDIKFFDRVIHADLTDIFFFFRYF